MNYCLKDGVGSGFCAPPKMRTVDRADILKVYPGQYSMYLKFFYIGSTTFSAW